MAAVESTSVISALGYNSCELLLLFRNMSGYLDVTSQTDHDLDYLDHLDNLDPIPVVVMRRAGSV